MSYIKTESGLNVPYEWIEQKDSAVGNLLFLATLGGAVWPSRNYTAFAQRGYMQNVIAYACVKKIVDSAISIPLFVKIGNQDATEHELISLINDPNPLDDGIDFQERLYSFLLIAGNTYMETVLVNSKPNELYTLRPDRIKLQVDQRGFPRAYVYTIHSQEYRFDVDFSRKQQQSLMHVKLFNPDDDWLGLSPLEPAWKSINTHNEAAEYNKSLLQNQAKPSGVLYFDGAQQGDKTMTEHQYRRLKKQIHEEYQGAANAGKPFLLEGGLRWEQVGMTNEELQYMEAKNSVAREIALALNTPPMLLGIPGDNTFANYKEANLAFYRQTVIPIVVRMCRAWTKFFKPTYGDKFQVLPDIDKIDAIANERAEAWDRVNNSTFLTTNEKREELNFGPLKESGEEVLVSASMIPLSDIGVGALDETDDNDNNNNNDDDEDDNDEEDNNNDDE